MSAAKGGTSRSTYILDEVLPLLTSILDSRRMVVRKT